jgi:RNA polymerase-binding transcription factor
MADWTEGEIAAFEAKLLSLRQELEESQAIAKDASDVVELDQQSVGRLSRMDALQSQAMAQETARRRQLDIRRIDAAVKRIEEGEYGYCATCGETIQRGRLELDPAAVTCVKHAK